MVFLLIQTYAGGWTCHLLKLRIETDSKTIIGYVFLNDDFREYFNNNEIAKYLSKYRAYPRDTIHVYDTIYHLNYPAMDGYRLTATLNQNITKVPVTRIKTIRTITKGPCNQWLTAADTTNYEYYYRWVGHTMPQDQLTMREIELLMNRPNFTISCPNPNSEYSALYIMSYSKNVHGERINQMLDEFKNAITNYAGTEPAHLFEAKKYNELKNAFRKENIIIIRLEFVA